MILIFLLLLLFFRGILVLVGRVLLERRIHFGWGTSSLSLSLVRGIRGEGGCVVDVVILITFIVKSINIVILFFFVVLFPDSPVPISVL